MNYKDIKKVTILGIGGKGAHYIAKFLNLLNIEIVGYDLKENEKSKELEELGIEIQYRNPNEGEKLEGDFFLYTNDLPQELQKRITGDNKGMSSYEMGFFYHMIIEDYEKNDMDKVTKGAFLGSNIAPLFKVDCSKMKYIGITGTDGKTSSCTMIYHVLKECGFKPALITTVSAKIGEKEIDTGSHTTTPNSQALFELIKQVEKEECTHIIIEATSHGLQQGRLAGLKFDIVGYTNITKEHLDYHKTWENYVSAKSLLIKKHLKKDGLVVLNKDDKAYDLLKDISSNHLDYSIKDETDLFSKDIVSNSSGLTFNLIDNTSEYFVSLPILGTYNVSNFLLCTGICKNLGVGIKDIVEKISLFKTVEGRMQVIQQRPFTVIVDYAHTPNAINVALTSVRELTKGRMIHVFGSAGHRDQYKRPEMGKFSNQLADITILTAEDCRQESLEKINDAIEEGWRDGGNKESEIYRFDYTNRDVMVRRDAIKKALELAKEGDLVIITGKAHEKSLCFGQIEYPWDDIVEVRKLLTTIS